MFSRLPLTALLVFESAARLGSFKLASEELSVTPAAISQRIRSLEERMGFKLFDRLPGRVVLTRQGSELYEQIHATLLDLTHAMESLRPNVEDAKITVTTTHSFAALWLVPRLGRFYDLYPTYQVQVETGPDVVDLDRTVRVDVAIRYGMRDYASLYCAYMLGETFRVYGTAEQIAHASTNIPSLISVTWHGSTLFEQGWRDWCNAAGLDWIEKGARQLTYTEENYALQAACAGQGLLLASDLMTAEYAGGHRLLPFRPEIGVNGAKYLILCRPGRERHPPVRAFLHWLTGEISEWASSFSQPGLQSGTRSLPAKSISG